MLPLLTCLLRLLVTEWANLGDKEKSNREKALQEMFKTWDAEVAEELRHLNKMASPNPRKRKSEALLEAAASEEGNRSSDEGSEAAPSSVRTNSAPKRKSRPSATVKFASSPRPSRSGRDETPSGPAKLLDGLQSNDDDLFDARFSKRPDTKKPKEKDVCAAQPELESCLHLP